MRPLRMTVKGFTSFRDPQEIDFTDLDLFALWGPTGSGKSSLLDALTYALYGKVERVGTEASQLVSQGQPRLAVTLDFAVGDTAYRIARSTTRSGNGTVRLEVADGDGWASYGPGADSIRQVNKIVPGLVGLDYDAFNRSVVLPQGRFAEFLKGEAAKRRAILTELLGLELFKTMAQRANERARDAKAQVDSKTALVEREYAGVDEDAVATAAETARERAAAEAAADAYLRSVKKSHDAWLDHERRVAGLRECSRDVDRLAKKLAADAGALDRKVKDLERNERAAETARSELGAAEDAAAEAAAARKALERRHGGLADVAERVGVVRRLEDARAELEAATATVADAEASIVAADEAVAEAGAAVTEADAALAAAEAARAEAAARHDAARRGDLVGALVADVAAGDPCPVCARPLARLPVVGSEELPAAVDHLEGCDRAAAAAREAAGATATRLALVEKDAEVARAGRDRAARTERARAARVAELEEELAAAFPKGVPADAAALLEAAAAELKDAVRRCDEAGATVAAARERVDDVDRERERIAGGVGAVRSTIEQAGLDACLDRVRAAAPSLDLPVLWPEGLPDAAGDLAAVAARLAKDMAVLARQVDAQVQDHLDAQRGLLRDARAAAPPGLEVSGDDLAALLDATGAAVRRAAEAKVLAEDESERLRLRLASRRELEDEIAAHQEEHRLYAALQRELKSDSIVEFLQAEALVSLAAAATTHLRNLSGERYRLSYEDDKFFVVDAWNGDERRDVRTLSGGETFVASLALALALSEQVQLLAVTERNRLESLFLDEGFGSLDAETLQVVVSAIEQLGVEDRLVGVITHVAELADRLPVRLEIVKSPRGSSIRRAEQELGLAGA
ncbi:MAG: AAA family ATPase [Actinomycetota bacterium]